VSRRPPVQTRGWPTRASALPPHEMPPATSSASSGTRLRGTAVDEVDG
jgi:hypothetical protein